MYCAVSQPILNLRIQYTMVEPRLFFNDFRAFLGVLLQKTQRVALLTATKRIDRGIIVKDSVVGLKFPKPLLVTTQTVHLFPREIQEAKHPSPDGQPRQDAWLEADADAPHAGAEPSAHDRCLASSHHARLRRRLLAPLGLCASARAEQRLCLADAATANAWSCAVPAEANSGQVLLLSLIHI